MILESNDKLNIELNLNRNLVLNKKEAISDLRYSLHQSKENWKILNEEYLSFVTQQGRLAEQENIKAKMQKNMESELSQIQLKISLEIPENIDFKEKLKILENRLVEEISLKDSEKERIYFYFLD